MLPSTTGRNYGVVELIQDPPWVVSSPSRAERWSLVRQSRPGSGTRTLEPRSGKLEEGENPPVAAPRELAEDAARPSEVLSAIGTFWAAPGHSTELVHVFEASGLSEADPLSSTTTKTSRWNGCCSLGRWTPSTTLHPSPRSPSGSSGSDE